METLSIAKSKFLNKYNPTESIEKAQSLAISAALQHNSLYEPNTSFSQKKIIRSTLAGKLMDISTKYISSVSEETYYNDIIELKDFMNQKYSDHFLKSAHPKYGYDPGFRISHSQKSLSVFLKHLWCIGKIEEPPQCPVDRIILTSIGQKSKNAAWGYVNSIEEHATKVNFIKEFIKNTKNPKMSLAKWELIQFSNGSF
ncbi:hypothetical protein [Algoriphagus formosus]|uniref:hypothetical protein n=1 Tax=Algoriphagus formosus TaxID=2007308 RepID=UPI000C2844F6|nr:hypothetical protein [Algoriphagus formosus]